MTKRQLTQDEINLCKSSISRIEQEMEYNQYIVDHADLMIRAGLRLNYEKQLREYTVKYNRATESVKESLDALAELKDQIQFGVEPKEKK